MARTFLVVNADDGNLTHGVLRGVLRAHDAGIVTSTTVFANRTLSPGMRKEFEERPDLAVGLHLNVTLGDPVSPPGAVRAILAGARFGKHNEHFFRAIDADALRTEYEAQIKRFSDWKGAAPSHLDTHHHIHRFEHVFTVVQELAFTYGIPFRLSECVNTAVRERFESDDITLADHLIPDIGPEEPFTRDRLDAVLRNLPDGIVELMTHPADIDEELKAISSFVLPRAAELDALSQPHLKSLLKEEGVELTNYSKLSVNFS